MRKKIDYKHLIEDVCSFKCENDNYSKSISSRNEERKGSSSKSHFSSSKSINFDNIKKDKE